MTVGQLQKILSKYPKDFPVYIELNDPNVKPSDIVVREETIDGEWLDLIPKGNLVSEL